MNTNEISRIQIDEHLAKGIPALSFAIGAIPLGDFVVKNIDMNNIHPNNWWRNNENDLDCRWLHSDVKDIAYYYIYPLFDSFLEEGELK